MPIVAGVALGAILVASLLIAFYLSYTQSLEPLLQYLADETPVVGKYVRRAIDAVGRRLRNAWNVAIAASTGLLASFIDGISDRIRDFLGSVTAFATKVASTIEWLVEKKIPDEIADAVRPIRNLARDAAQDASDAAKAIDRLRDRVETDIHGIEGTVQAKIDAATRAIRNVDLPELERTLGREIGAAERSLSHDIDLLDRRLEHELGNLLGKLNDIPLDKLLPLIVAVPAIGALVDIIATESGLDKTECRGKVKNICSTPVDEWANLLDDLIPVALAFSLTEIFQVIYEVGNDWIPDIAEVLS